MNHFHQQAHTISGTVALAQTTGVRWNDEESWWVCDECRSATENLLDFQHEPGCQHAA